MNELKELEIAKSVIKLSITLSSEKKLLLPSYDKNNDYQTILYKAISELKSEGVINLSVSVNGEMVITLK